MGDGHGASCLIVGGLLKENIIKTTLVLGGGALLVLFLLLRRPGYLANSSSLATLIGAEILVLAITRFTSLFFPLVIATFVAAGIHIPEQGAFAQARWIVLGVGAVVGVAIYMKSQGHHFGAFHLIVVFCILSAAVSASVSQYTWESKLKALSLGLLLVYASSGARLAAFGLRGETFFLGLVKGCEVLVWFCGTAYLVFRWQFFGNPNSLGAIAGVVLVPVLLWGMLTSKPGGRRVRLSLELALAALLLMSSFSRAGIGSALFSSVLICVTLRRYRLMVKGSTALLLFAFCTVTLIPHLSYMPEVARSQSLTDAYLYKGKEDAGVLGSRRSVWQETWSSIQENPWFGTGFGTSKVAEDMSAAEYAAHHIDSWIVREHGNSYLAIAEWTGMLGVVPFYALIVLTAVYAGKIFVWLRRTGNVFSPAVPAAAIIVAGLFDAMFEDWMFAVGYYLCVFFWVVAFIMVDALPWRVVVVEPRTILMHQQDSYLPAASGQ